MEGQPRRPCVRSTQALPHTHPGKTSQLTDVWERAQMSHYKLLRELRVYFVQRFRRQKSVPVFVYTSSRLIFFLCVSYKSRFTPELNKLGLAVNTNQSCLSVLGRDHHQGLNHSLCLCQTEGMVFPGKISAVEYYEVCLDLNKSKS